MEHNEDPLNWLGTIGIGIIVIILIYLTITTFFSTCKLLKSIEKTSISQGATKTLLVITCLSILSFTTAAILMFIMATASLVLNKSRSRLVYKAGIYGILVYVLSQSIMLFVFTFRVQVISNAIYATKLGYSKRLVITLKIISTILSTFFVFIIIILRTGIPIIMTYACFGLWSILYLGMSITLMILFIKPIEKLMFIQQKSRFNTADASDSLNNYRSASSADLSTDPSNSDPTTPNEVDIARDDNTNESKDRRAARRTKLVVNSMVDSDFLYIVIKHGLLVPTAIISSFVLFMTGATIAALTNPAAFHITAYFWYSLDCMVSSTCTYLLCASNQRLYGILCNKVHSNCERRKMKKITKKLKKDEVGVPQPSLQLNPSDQRSSTLTTAINYTSNTNSKLTAESTAITSSPPPQNDAHDNEHKNEDRMDIQTEMP